MRLLLLVLWFVALLMVSANPLLENGVAVALSDEQLAKCDECVRDCRDLVSRSIELASSGRRIPSTPLLDAD